MDKNLPWKPLEFIGAVDNPHYRFHPIRNLMNAIEFDDKPQCSGEDARWAVEMVNAVYHSHIAKLRVEFPLKDRSHPLLSWKS